MVINDLHLGVNRVAGTTQESLAALRDFSFLKHERLLHLAVPQLCNRIIINGDLTDAYDIPLALALRIYVDTARFLTAQHHIELIWALGNHDLAKDSAKLGTVAFVGALLAGAFPGRFKLVSKPTRLDDTYIIPHVVNQDVFDLELGRVPEGVKYLLLHCNMDNKFAAEAEHSLNLDRETAKALKARGITLVLGHEHQGRELMKGSVLITGNQYPTSISDCLTHGDAQKDGTKRALIIDHDEGSHQFITTWTPDDEGDGWFARADWRELADVEEDGRGFIRVEGEAAVEEAADVIKAISNFRSRSKSFVVANAVKVATTEGLEDIADSIEDIRAVDVMELLLDSLDPDQQAAVKKLLRESCDA